MKEKTLFIYTNYSSFVKIDFEILSLKNQVIKYRFKPSKGILKNGFQFFKQLMYLVFNIWKFDSIFIWFADYHSFLPILFAKFLKKKSFIVIGGYDVANIPELGYGSFSSPLRKRLTLYSLKQATLCIPVVESLEDELRKLCPVARSQTIHTGYKFELKKEPDYQLKRENIILTVSLTENKQRLLIKGLDRFRELAINMPNFTFYIIGVKEDARNLFEPIPINLHLLPSLNQIDLIPYYKKASFYAQFSRSEGLPNALCEAMLYGCIPLGTQIGGIPTAIENTGLVVEKWVVQKVIEFINKTNNSSIDREQIKNRIITKFDSKSREFRLIQLITS